MKRRLCLAEKHVQKLEETGYQGSIVEERVAAKAMRRKLEENAWRSILTILRASLGKHRPRD